MYIIGLSGKSGSGKDYIAKIMYDLWGYYPLPLALGVKLDAISKFGATYEEAFITKPPHIRELLQKIGTDSGRMFYGEDMWINATYSLAQWFETNWGINKFVLPDVRFRNEMKFIQDSGNFVFKVVADTTLKKLYGLKGEAAKHPSEIDLDEMPVGSFDGIILNRHNEHEKIQNQLEGILTSLKWNAFSQDLQKPETD